MYQKYKIFLVLNLVVLVGTKSDLVDDKKMLAALARRNMKPVTQKQAKVVADEIGAVTYIEISSMNDVNVRKVIEEGLSYMYRAAVTEKEKKDKCVIV